MKGIKSFWRCESGNATEYVLILALVSLMIFSGAGILADALVQLFKRATDAFGFG